MRRQEFLMCAGAHILNISFYPIPKLRRKPHIQFLTPTSYLLPKFQIPAMIQRVERMTARQRVRTTAHFTSSAPNLSTFRRVRPSPPW